MQMTSWQATTFLIGENFLNEGESHPIYTMADGILSLTQEVYRNSMVRKIQVIKMRGQALKEGLHTFRIRDDGIRIFPRASSTHSTSIVFEAAGKSHSRNERLSFGIPQLDEMLGGGLPSGYSMLILGPAGSGKTTLAADFLAAGVRRNEFGLIAAFDKNPGQMLNSKLNMLIEGRHIGMVNTRSLDMSIDETLHELINMISQVKVKRLVLDSLGGFEFALAPEFREEFRGLLYWMLTELTARGVTVLMTSEFEGLSINSHSNSSIGTFFSDAIIMQQYIETESQIQRVMLVMKVRGSNHSKDIHLFEVTDEGIKIGKILSGYSGSVFGIPSIGLK